MTVRNIAVSNKTKHPMWVTIQTERYQVTSIKMRRVGDTDFETFVKIIMNGEAKVALPEDIAGIGVSGGLTNEVKSRLREYYEKYKEEQYQWNGFIVSGALRIDRQQSNFFAVEGAGKVYYLSARNAELGIFASNVPRSEDEIIIDEKGIYDKCQYKCLIHAPADNVFLKALNGKFIGIPPLYGTFDPAPAGKVDEAAAKHKILVEGDYITSGKEARIRCLDEQTDRNCMYSTLNGAVYYKPYASWNQQIWKIAKTGNPNNSLDERCWFGDEVKIINMHWPEAILTYDDENWLRCHNDNTVADDKKKWILCSTPTG